LDFRNPLDQEPSSRPRLESYAALHNLKSQRLVHSLRYLVMDRRIRSHLDTSLAARPIFRSSQEFRSNPLLPPVLRDVPTIHMTDEIACLASIGVPAQTGFRSEEHTSELQSRGH